MAGPTQGSNCCSEKFQSSTSAWRQATAVSCVCACVGGSNAPLAMTQLSRAGSRTCVNRDGGGRGGALEEGACL